MQFNSEKIRDIIREFLHDDGLVFSKDPDQIYFDLETVINCVNENSEIDTDNERRLAYAKGFVIFADVLKQYAEHYVKELSSKSSCEMEESPQ